MNDDQQPPVGARTAQVRLSDQEFKELEKFLENGRNKQAFLRNLILAAIRNPKTEQPVHPDLKWHGYLDEVLKDPEERIGIEINLKWAVREVRSKRRESGRRKSRAEG